MRMIMTVAAAAMLAGCGGNAPGNNAAAEASADKLQPGEYELTSTKVQIESTDKTTPATKAGTEEGAKTAFLARACAGADGTLDPAAFTEAGDKCTADSNYARGGRISMQINCTRDGQSGNIGIIVDGSIKSADAFEANVTGNTYFAGSGDYTLTRTVTGKRVGNCPPAAPAAPEAPKAD